MIYVKHFITFSGMASVIIEMEILWRSFICAIGILTNENGIAIIIIEHPIAYGELSRVGLFSGQCVNFYRVENDLK